MLAGCGGTKTVVRTVTVAPPPGSNEQLSYFGHIVSAQPTDGGYLLRFDPAWFLNGVTANVALAQSLHTTCAPRACAPVSNDNYVLDETHGTLVFVLPHSTSGTVLTRPLALPGRRIGADRLVQLVAQGGKAALYEPLESGVWLRVRGDTVVAFAQQYRP